MCWWNIWYIECWCGRRIRYCLCNTPEMFDGLTDEENIDVEQLYGDKSLEIDIALQDKDT